jgi:Ca2+-transporting ATPase
MCATTDSEKGAKKGAQAEALPVCHWHVMSAEDCLKVLKVGRKEGLSSEEAQRRLEEYGPNQLSEQEKKTMLQRIWAQVNNILVLVLVVVALVSGSRAITSATAQDKITNWIEVALIAFVVILNAWIGIMQVSFTELKMFDMKMD